MKTILIDAAYTLTIEQNGKFVVYDELVKLLDTYQNHKIVVTNANPEQAKNFAIDKVKYDVFSLENNPNKSNPEYFNTLLAKYNLEPEEVVYFEHSQEAVESARSVGIVAYYYDDKEKDLSALKAFLDDNL